MSGPTSTAHPAVSAAAAKLCRAGLKAAVVAAVVIAIAACEGSPPGAPGPRTPSRSSSHNVGWKDFVAPSSTSGCPSPACSDILAQVQAGATTRNVPSNLSPTLQDATNDLVEPAGGSCSELPVSGLESSDQPCVFGAEGPMVILIGNSRAVMWSQAFLALSSRLGHRLGFVAHQGCSMLRVANPPRTGAVSAAECKDWQDAAVNWVQQQNPALVFVAGGPDLAGSLSPTEVTTGWVAALKELQGPGRKVFVFGELPHMTQSPTNCLAAHSSSALQCASRTSAAIQVDEQQAGLDAAKQAGASYVNLTPWVCTEDVCPAIVGQYLSYRDTTHLTSTYAEALVPALQEVINQSHR
jgi:hypothetical protein